jgi:peptide/nickel transport system substrate-binding protein
MIASKTEADALLKTNPDVRFTVSLVTSAIPNVNFNLNNPKYQDVRIRRALSLAMNRDEMVQLVYQGYAKIVGNIPWYYFADSEPKGSDLGNWMRYDPDEAAKLLQAAGAQGLVMNDLHYNYLSDWTQKAEVYVNELDTIGVKLNLTAGEYNQFNSVRQNGQIEDMTVTGFANGGVGADGATRIRLSSTSAGNIFHVNDPTIEPLLEAQKNELDGDKRREILKQIYDREMDQMYGVPFPTGPYYNAQQPWVRGLRPDSSLGWNYSYAWMEELRTLWIDK